MFQFDNFYFLFGFVQYKQNRRGIFSNFLNLNVTDIALLSLFLQKQSRLLRIHVVETNEVPPTLLIAPPIGNQWLGTSWLRVEHNEVEIVSVVFTGRNNKQILPNLTVLNHSINRKSSDQLRLLNIHNLYQFLLTLLEHKSRSVHRQNFLQITHRRILLELRRLVNPVDDISHLLLTTTALLPSAPAQKQPVARGMTRDKRATIGLNDGAKTVGINVQIDLRAIRNFLIRNDL